MEVGASPKPHVDAKQTDHPNIVKLGESLSIRYNLLEKYDSLELDQDDGEYVDIIKDHLRFEIRRIKLLIYYMYIYYRGGGGTEHTMREIITNHPYLTSIHREEKDELVTDAEKFIGEKADLVEDSMIEMLVDIAEREHEPPETEARDVTKSAPP